MYKYLRNCNKIRLLAKHQISFLRKYTKFSYKHKVGNEPLRALTLGQLAEETCQKHGDRYAVISRHQNQKIKYAEALALADRLAAGFLKMGFSPGDRIGIWAPNLVEWYITALACGRAGFLLVCLNPAYQSQEIEYCIKKVGIKGIVCSQTFKTQNYYELLRAVCKELPESESGNINSENLTTLKTVVILSEDNLKGALKFSDVLNFGDGRTDLVNSIQQRIKIDDACHLQFTSGTTGKPKAAAVSHFSAVNNGFYIGKRNELADKHHKICVQVPLFHAFGTIITFASSLNHGATLILPSPSFNAEQSLDALKEEKCTIIHGTPTMYVDLVRVQRERQENICAEIAVSGGASCSPHLFKSMLEVLKVKRVKSVYGLSETTAVVFQSLPGDGEYEATSTVGCLHEHIEAKVVDENGHMVPVGTPGELCIRGYANMLGYWEDPKKTEEIMGPSKWLHTGDQFVMDENGYGKIVGRLKEMIIRGGENIYPKEVEDFLNTHPDILDTQVIGLPHERLGEEVCACIRIRKGKNVTHDELKTFCKGKIAHFKVPSVIKVVDSFPTTASGKIQKFKLVESILKK